MAADFDNDHYLVVTKDYGEKIHTDFILRGSSSRNSMGQRIQNNTVLRSQLDLQLLKMWTLGWILIMLGRL
jgi:hypothetical protein